MSIIKVTGETFEAEVVRSELPVLVDFFADWCQPCHMLTPIVEELASEYAGKVKFVKIDIDADGKLADRFNASMIPYLVLLKGGEMAGKVCVGVKPPSVIRTALEEALNGEKK